MHHKKLFRFGVRVCMCVGGMHVCACLCMCFLCFLMWVLGLKLKFLSL